ncbi:DUF4129 domain-containing protein [Longimicrobium sp.]|uniref:DUF4129 domain-containing protein n=1 Tax=Longimicrobium sp. TaxID=2029185 RepID=UPI002E32DBE8|nr:DUF4129 domain-containing protein [Longimicrobium sp.]HEX6040897.1 DUF4129 domain-containing protein [Longimicrobium sp.]
MQTRLSTDAEVRAALERVYARPELAPRQPGLMDGFNEFMRRLFGRIGDWFDSFGNLRSENPVVYWLVMGALILLGLAIVAYFVRNTLLRLEDRGAAPRATRGKSGAIDARARTAGEWEEEARRAAAAGRFRDAAVALYQALLLRLEAAGVLRYDPSKTPGDYRRESRKDPRAAGALTTFLRGFEPVVFGGRALDAAGYDRLRGAAGEAGAHG